MKTITIQVPDGWEVQIVRKEDKKEPVIKTYQDLIDNKIKISGYWITGSSQFEQYQKCTPTEDERNLAASEKVAKSMLAMAMISQLLPFYGGAITDEEWNNWDVCKYCLVRDDNRIHISLNKSYYHFLAFHTPEQRDEFLKYNEQLVKDYLMID